MARSIWIVFTHADLSSVGEGDILPIRPDVFLRASEGGRAGDVRDVADFLSSLELNRCFHVAARCAGRFVHEARKPDRPAWLEGVGAFEVQRAAHVTELFFTLLRRLAERYDAVHVPSRTQAEEVWSVKYEFQGWVCLHQAACDLRARNFPIAWYPDAGDAADAGCVSIKRLIAAGKTWAGRLIDVLEGCCAPAIIRDEPETGEPTTADVVLAGVQITDVALQADLAADLARRWGDRFLWLRMNPTVDLEVSERRAEDSPASECRTANVARMPLSHYRNWRYSVWMSHYVCGLTAEILASGRPGHDALSMGRRRLASALYETIGRGAPIRHRMWLRFLRRMNPRVLLGFSLLHDMAVIFTAARRAGIPFVLLPHAGGYDLILYQVKSGDFAVAMGRFHRKTILQDRLFPSAIETRVAAPSFMPSARNRPRPSRGEQRELLFLENVDFTFPIYTTAGALLNWLDDAGSAAKEAALELVLRAHPRFGTLEFYEAVARRLRAKGVAVRVDRRSDLNDRFRCAAAIVSLNLDTACIKAFAAGVPVVFHFPTSHYYFMQRVARRASLHTAGRAELGRTVRRLLDDDAWRAETIRRQDQFLDEYLEQSPNEGHRVEVKFVEDILAGTAA